MTDTNIVAISPVKAGEIMEAVIVKGDLEQLSPQERAKYYVRVCESIGLNPMTKPFEYIKLNGRLRLYALKDATDQLRKIYNVSVTDLTETERDGVFIVTAKVRDASGRTDAAKGAVTLGGLKGEALANALMKCETKAKRRATLSICGLGFLDETEIEDIPAAPRVLKKDTRGLYLAMQTELDVASGSIDSLRAWRAASTDRIVTLPPDWQNNIETIITEKVVDLRAGREPRPSGEILSERWGDEQGRRMITAASPSPAPTVITSTLDDPPDTGEIIWSEPDPPEWSSKWDELGPVKQAGILCNEAGFAKFVVEIADGTTWPTVADFVREHCGVRSRKDLATNEAAAKKWRRLVEEYRAWQRADEPPHGAAPAPSVSNHPGPDAEGATTDEPLADDINESDKLLAEAAKKGSAALEAAWKKLPKAHGPVLKKALDLRHKPAAKKADALGTD